MGGHAAVLRDCNLIKHSLAKSLFGCPAMEGVVNVHPMDWEIMALAECFVSEHLYSKITELDVQATIFQFFSYRHKHSEKQIFFFVCAFLIFASAKYQALTIEIW